MDAVLIRVEKYLFRNANGLRPRSFNGMLTKLVRKSGLLTDRAETNALQSATHICFARTLFWNRHTHVKQANGQQRANFGTELQQTNRHHGSSNIVLKMINKIKLVTATAVLALLTACGGGGGGGTAAPVASTESFPLSTAYRNTLTSSSSNTYTISGTSSGVAVTGSGTVTFGNLSAGTFEGLPAQQRTTTSTGSVIVGGVTLPLNTSSVTWVDSNYVPKGESGGEDYVVVTGTPSIPTTARINDTGTLYTANRYASSTKTVLRGTITATYVMEADTASTALVTFIKQEKNTANVTTGTYSAQFRITTAGASTRIKETGVDVADATTLTITY